MIDITVIKEWISKNRPSYLKYDYDDLFETEKISVICDFLRSEFGYYLTHNIVSVDDEIKHYITTKIVKNGRIVECRESVTFISYEFAMWVVIGETLKNID